MAPSTTEKEFDMNEQIVLGAIIKNLHVSFELPILRPMMYYHLSSMSGDKKAKKEALEDAVKVLKQHPEGIYATNGNYKEGLIKRLMHLDSLDTYESYEEKSEALATELVESTIDLKKTVTHPTDDEIEGVELFYGPIPKGFLKDLDKLMKK